MAATTKPTAAFRGFGQLIDQCSGHVAVACDTEFVGPHTLTAQFAARIGEDVVVQVYHSPDVRPQPDGEELAGLFPPEIGKWYRSVIIRPCRPLQPNLAPAGVLADLFGIDEVEPFDLIDSGRVYETEPPDASLTVTFVGHFWTADFFRMFGRDHFSVLVEHQRLTGRLALAAGKMLNLREVGAYRAEDPVIGYAWYPGGGELGTVCEIRARYFDTFRTFGSGGRLEDLARTFVGTGKLEGFGEAEKADMLATFNREPVRAYAYAALDAVLTLLLQERMEVVHREMYREAGFGEEDVPPLRPTLGSRVSDMAVRYFARAGLGSVRLSTRGREVPDGGAGPPSLAKFKALLARGSGSHIAERHLSAFGGQTGQTHGGLNYSRSPTVLFHNAPGQFRDIDLSGCYANVMLSMVLYAGQPIVYEPGAWEEAKEVPLRSMTLKEGIDFVRDHSAGRDAWFIKASGPVTSFPNGLIPSTKDALTNDNWKKRTARRKANQPPPTRYGLAFDRPDDGKKATGNTAILTDVVEAGIVAWPTWLMIQALPPRWREEYENLTVDSIIFYPRRLVAGSAAEYDELVGWRTFAGTPWTASLDVGRLEKTVRHRLDDEYVALRCDLGGLARLFQERRERAKAGGDGAADKAWKEQVNSLYGVVASQFLPTNNVVAANVITATARALAFALHLSLNGVQVITDGCTYRRDQIPAGTLAECLAGCPDYPINRADFVGPFLDPASIPDDDAGFTDWYRDHVKRFFGVSGQDYDALFSRHELAHKGGPFDGLCCDGSANYVKLSQDGEWKAIDFKARSFRSEAKDVLAPWIVRAYSADGYDGPPPVLESRNIVKYKPAAAVARRALQAGCPSVYFPLGLDRRWVQTYKVIKRSAFLFRTPKQFAAWDKVLQKFGTDTGCGLEVLSLRETSADRRKGSLADVAAKVYRMIRDGMPNPRKPLNLDRLPPEVRPLAVEVRTRKEAATDELIRTIDERGMDEATKLTGLFVTTGDILRIV